MNKKLLYLTLPLLLTGCIGSWLTGQTEYLGEDYPDIRTVPSRAEATAPRGNHEGDERTARAVDKQKLEQDLAQLKARNEAAREEAFRNK